MKTFAAIIVAVLLSSVALAAEQKDIESAPYFRNLGSIGNNSTLTMKCIGDAPYTEIDCSFIQVIIGATSPEEKEKNRKEIADELDKLKPDEFDKYKKEFTGIDKTKVKQIADKSTKEQNAVSSMIMKFIGNIEIAKDRSMFKKAMIDFIDFTSSACKISLNTFDLHFTRINRNKWIYNPGPQGFCNVVKVITIENTPEYPELWTFSQIIASADKDAECKKWVEVGTTIVNSWDAPKALMFEQCKYLDFGL